jgi:predicted metal-dependent hydrolase
MGTGAMIHIPSIIEIGSSIQKLVRGVNRRRQHADCMNLLFFKTKESKLKVTKGYVSIATASHLKTAVAAAESAPREVDSVHHADSVMNRLLL